MRRVLPGQPLGNRPGHRCRRFWTDPGMSINRPLMMVFRFGLISFGSANCVRSGLVLDWLHLLGRQYDASLKVGLL